MISEKRKELRYINKNNKIADSYNRASFIFHGARHEIDSSVKNMKSNDLSIKTKLSKKRLK